MGPRQHRRLGLPAAASARVADVECRNIFERLLPPGGAAATSRVTPSLWVLHRICHAPCVLSLERKFCQALRLGVVSCLYDAPVAQRIEHRISNPTVAGSIPARRGETSLTQPDAIGCKDVRFAPCFVGSCRRDTHVSSSPKVQSDAVRSFSGATGIAKLAPKPETKLSSVPVARNSSGSFQLLGRSGSPARASESSPTTVCE